MGLSLNDNIRNYFKEWSSERLLGLFFKKNLKVFKESLNFFGGEYLFFLGEYVGMLGVCGLCRRRWDQLTLAAAGS